MANWFKKKKKKPLKKHFFPKKVLKSKIGQIWALKSEWNKSCEISNVLHLDLFCASVFSALLDAVISVWIHLYQAWLQAQLCILNLFIFVNLHRLFWHLGWPPCVIGNLLWLYKPDPRSLGRWIAWCHRFWCIIVLIMRIRQAFLNVSFLQMIKISTFITFSFVVIVPPDTPMEHSVGWDGYL